MKAIWTGNDPTHYMKAMNRKNGPHLLHEYAPISIEAIADYLEGRSVMGDAGKEIYLIRNRTKCTFGSYELFLKMGFTDRVKKLVFVCFILVTSFLYLSRARSTSQIIFLT